VVLISVTVDPRAIMRPEGLCQRKKIPVTLSAVFFKLSVLISCFIHGLTVWRLNQWGCFQRWESRILFRLSIARVKTVGTAAFLAVALEVAKSNTYCQWYGESSTSKVPALFGSCEGLLVHFPSRTLQKIHIVAE